MKLKFIDEGNFDYNTKLEGFLELQNLIKEKIENNEKFLIGRLSGIETNFVGKLITGNKINNNLLYSMSNNTGILIKNNEDIKEYIKEYIKSVKNSDLLGIWRESMCKQCIEFYKYLEISKINTNIIPAQSLELFYYLNEDKYILDEIIKDKKILIITSHSNTTKKQIKIIEKIYENKRIFNNNKFFVYKPPSQHCGNSDGNSWLFHFNKMKEELKRIKEIYNFDIALVSCGGFGMPIVNYIYEELNSSAIYVGGGLQLYFGILGKRWSNNKTINELKNQYWCYPEESDRPKNINNVEGGCYW
jgi:hypothetical protein